MNIRQAISRVKNIFKQVNSDSRITNKFIYTILQNNANWLIYREFEKLKLPKLRNLIQPLNCLEIIEASKIDSCCGVSSKCVVYRTKNKIPKLYESSKGPIIISITSIDDSKDIKIITPYEVIRKLQDPFQSKSINKYAFYNDGYLYFPKGSYKKVKVLGLFREDVSEENCEDCKDQSDNTKCKLFLDKNFIFPEYLESQLFEAIENELSSIYMKIPEKSHTINKNDNA